MNSIDFYVLIPARRNSTRLANKMLLNIAGIPLIIHTARNAMKSDAKSIIVATDDNEIYNICKSHNINVIMTSNEHTTGTDRIAEAIKIIGLKQNDIVVNVQGDEPLISHKLINKLAKFLYEKQVSVATVAHIIKNEEDITNPNIVKVVLDKNNCALYFSRSIIPYDRDSGLKFDYLRHFGMYVYTVEFLKNYKDLEHTNLENIEKLEQLRILYHGIKLATLISNDEIASGVDTLEDYLFVKKIMEEL
jgi:3-deoxy-manno-octulosonate cytidylyltransferase (CMP-KDO synthetase)